MEKPVVDYGNVDIVVLRYFAAFPEDSKKQCWLESGITRSTIQRIFYKPNFHTCAISLVQGLKILIIRSEFILVSVF